MGKCSSCSKANRWRVQTNRRIEEIKACTAQYIQTIERLLQELNETYAKVAENDGEDDQDNGKPDDDEAESENDDSDSDDIHGDNSFGQTNAYFCPESECRQRKADATFKKYSRHYKTHVECKVSCAGCHTTLGRVSTLKRHFTHCAELKKKRQMAEHTEAIEQMKGRMDAESKMASYKARGVLEGHKRRRQSNLNTSESRKKARSENCSDASFPTNGACSKNSPIVSNHVIDLEPNGCSIADATEQQMEAHIGSRLSSGPSVMMTTSLQSSYPDSQLSAQNSIMTSTGALEFANKTIDGLAMYIASNQYSTVQDTVAATKSKNVLNETMDESATCTHNQYPTAQSSATATDSPSTYFTNNQCSTTKDTAPAMRGSSFMSHTMDGSFMYTDDQYPMAQNAVAAMRGSSFVNNTMDGSFLYTGDKYPTVQNATMQSLESWRPA